MSPNYPPRKKQNTFLVDTKSSCFLCLKEIPADPPPVSIIMLNEGDDHDAVQLKLLGGMKEAQTKNKELFCLRSVFKLLKLDTGKVLSKNLSAGPFLLPNLVNMDLTVVLCNSCFQVTTRLTSLFTQLEVLQMKLDNAIRNFSEILRSSKDSNQLAQSSKVFLDLDPLDLLHRSIAELIRKETLEKCSRYFQMWSWPKVNMSSGKNVVVSSTVCSDTTSTSVTVPISYTTKNIIQEDTFTTTPFNLNQLQNMNLDKQENDSVSNQMQIKHALSALKYNCSACGRRFKDKKSIYRHRKDHCEFRSGASKVMAQVKKGEEGNKCETGHRCHVCPRTFRSFASLSLHLRGKHQLSAVSSTKYMCSACGVRFKNRSSIYRHRLQNCKFQFSASKLPAQDDTTPLPTCINLNELVGSFPRLKVEDEDQVVLCGLCPSQNNIEKFREDQVKRHVFTHHPNYLFAPVRLPECNEDKFRELCREMLEEDASQMEMKLGEDDADDGGTTFNCSNCAHKYSDKWSMYEHMIEAHCSIYASKLVGWQRSRVHPDTLTPQNAAKNYTRSLAGNFPCQNCGQIFRDRTSLWRHGRFSCSYRNKNDASSEIGDATSRFTHCRDCGKKLKTQMGRHLEKFCLYRHRVKDDDPVTSQPSSNVASSLSSVFLYRCLECKVEFRLHSMLQEHIASVHLNSIRQVGETGGTCEQCGTYFINLRSHMKLGSCSADKRGRAPPGFADCEHCGIRLRKCSLWNHRHKTCPMATKATVTSATTTTTSRTLTTNTGRSSLLPENFPREAVNAKETDSEAEEEEPIELNQGSFSVGTKIEVMEPSRVQVFTEQPFQFEHVDMVKPGHSKSLEIENTLECIGSSSSCAHSDHVDDDKQTWEDAEMMALADDEDPLNAIQ